MIIPTLLLLRYTYPSPSPGLYHIVRTLSLSPLVLIVAQRCKTYQSRFRAHRVSHTLLTHSRRHFLSLVELYSKVWEGGIAGNARRGVESKYMKSIGLHDKEV